MKRALILALVAVFAAVPAAQAKPAKPAQSQACKKPQAVGFVAVGALSAYDASSVTLTVSAANRPARDYLASHDPIFSIASARVGFEGVTDSNDDTNVGFDDVLPTDLVVVIGKLTKPKHGCTGSQSLSIRMVEVVREAEETESD
jgi:hypothetical protein